MEKIISKKFNEEDIKLLSSLIGQKITSIHHDEFTLGNLSIKKVGIRTKDDTYSLETDFEYVDFLWGEEGVAGLQFIKTDENGLIVKTKPPIKYVNEEISDILIDIIIVRDEIEEFENDVSMGRFEYDKGIVLVFKDHQIGIELDSWMAEMIKVFRSSDAAKKFASLNFEWNNELLDPGYMFKATRTEIHLKKLNY